MKRDLLADLMFVVAILALVATLAATCAGCLYDPDAIADDQPVEADAKVDICVSGFEAASEHTGIPMQLVIPLCESVDVGDDCIVVCNVHGRGLICDSDGCEEHVRP